MFWQDLERFDDAIALIAEDGTRMDYAALARAADAAGFGGGVRRLALLELDNSVASLVAYLGALRAGHAVILANTGADAAFADLRARYRPELVWTHGRLESVADAPVVPLHPDLCVMLSTSGSTGSSKLVRLSAAAVDANARSIVEYLHIKSHARAITSLPPAYSYGLSVLNSHLAAGAAIVLTTRSVIEPGFAALLRREGVTSIAGVPYSYEMMAKSGLLDALPPSVSTLTQAGGRLVPTLVERVRIAAESQGARFFVMYGQTEATARMAYMPPEHLAAFPDCIGRAIPGGRLDLRDPETGAATPHAGELFYTGPNVMMGYAEAREDLARGAEIDALATGDLAEKAGPDLLRITGRKSRFVKLFGLRIALDEVERAARAEGWTATVAGDDSRIVVAVEDQRDPAALADSLASRYKVPADRIVAVRVDPLPRLPTGKPDYRGIMAAAPIPDPDAATAGGIVAYRALLTKLARGNPVDDDSSFETIGGDSLNFVEASILLERTLGELPDGWDAMTLGDLTVLAGAAPRKAGAARSRVDSDILVRVCAILAIIVGHGFGLGNEWLKGGADVLLMAAGFGLAKYNFARFTRGQGIGVVADVFLKYVLFYYAIMALYALAGGEVRWQQWLLIGNYGHRPDGILTFYWFIEAWFQGLLVFSLLFLFRPIRDFAVRRPLAFASTLVAGSVILKGLGYLWSEPSDLRFRSLDQTFGFMAAGWALAFMRTHAERALVMAVAVLYSFSSWGGDNSHPWLLLALSMVLASGWRPRMPTPLAAMLRTTAMASFYIYILGTIPTHLAWNRFGEASGWQRVAVVVVHLIVTLAIGIAAWHANRIAVDRIVRPLWQRMRSGHASSPTPR